MSSVAWSSRRWAGLLLQSVTYVNHPRRPRPDPRGRARPPRGHVEAVWPLAEVTEVIRGAAGVEGRAGGASGLGLVAGVVDLGVVGGLGGGGGGAWAEEVGEGGVLDGYYLPAGSWDHLEKRRRKDMLKVFIFNRVS